MIFIIAIISTLAVDLIAPEKPRMHILTKKEKEIIVRTHNKVRRELSKRGNIVPDLKWDEDLSKFAFHYIRNGIDRYGKCPQKHNPDRCWYHNSTVDGVGENVAHNTLPFINDSIWLWINERKDYTYSKVPERSNNNGPVTGHYTQLVWGRTHKIGCAIGINCLGFDSKPYKMMLLCNYWPSGNVANQFPYYESRNPDDWKVFDYSLSDMCRYTEDKKHNWDMTKNSLKTPVPQPYHKLKLPPAKKSLYDELMPDNLKELICNIVKEQSMNESRPFGMDRNGCEKMRRRPIKKKLTGIEIRRKNCWTAYRLAKKESVAFHNDYCRHVLRHRQQ